MCVTMETVVMLQGIPLWPIHMVNKTFIEAEECYGLCICVCVCLCECMCRQSFVCPCVCDVGPPAVTPRSAPFCPQTKSRLFPPDFNCELPQHCWPFTTELTKYFPFCSEFVSINRFALWGFLSPLALCFWYKTLELTGGHIHTETKVGHLV